MSTTAPNDGPSGGLSPDLDRADPGYGEVPAYGPSLWRRMVQAFLGDPITGNLHLAPPGAASGLAIPDFAIAATVTITGDSARWTFDGSGAGAANGIVTPAGTVFNITGRASLKGASIFPNSAATVVDVVFWT